MPGNITFLHPYFLLLLLGIPVLLYFWIKESHRKNSALQIPASAAFFPLAATFKSRLFKTIPYIRAAQIALIIIALARPQKPSGLETLSNEGIDIVLSTDVSGSMLAEDFSPNRLEAAKRVAADFINNRPQDRIGLVVFSGESFTLCPITSDHNVLKNMFTNVAPGMLQDGTAIGMGLATATDRLRESKAKSKVIILLTDGINNTGIIDPATAAEIAQKFGIKVYTIGMSSGAARVNIQGYGQYQQAEVDEELMKQIAKITGGKYFQATDDNKLSAIYNEINRLEKTKVESARFLPKAEAFYSWLCFAFVFLMLEFLLRFTYLKSLT